jgi:hypothetical protein
LVPAEPVVMNTGVFGTVTPALSASVERVPNSARVLDGERGGWAFLENVFGTGGVAGASDCAGLGNGDCDTLDRDAAVCGARSPWSRKNQQRLLVPGSMR